MRAVLARRPLSTSRRGGSHDEKEGFGLDSQVILRNRPQPYPASLASAMSFALMAALLSWSFTTIAVAAKHPMTSVKGFVAIETAFTAVQFTLVGPLFALASRL